MTIIIIIIIVITVCMAVWVSISIKVHYAPLRRVEEDIRCEQLRTIRANFCGWLHVGTCHNIEWQALTNLEFIYGNDA